MAEFQSPLSGTLKAARTTVSSDIFNEALRKSDETNNLLRTQNSVLTSIASGLNNIRDRVTGLDGSLQNISRQITSDSFLEKQRLLQEQQQERILAQQQLREGKESVIERKIQSALLAPVQRIGNVAKNTLSSLATYFTTVLGGWLLNQGIETLKAYSEGSKEKLIEIRDNVLKTLGVVGGIFIAVRYGIGALIRGVASLSAKIVTAVANNLFKKPLTALASAIRLPGSKPPTATPASGGPKPGVKPGSGGVMGALGSGASSLARGAMGALGTTGITAGLDILMGEEPTRALAGGGGAAVATGVVSRLPLPPILKFPAMIGSAIWGQQQGKEALDFLSGSNTQSNTQSKPPETPAVPEPKNQTSSEFSEPPPIPGPNNQPANIQPQTPPVVAPLTITDQTIIQPQVQPTQTLVPEQPIINANVFNTPDYSQMSMEQLKKMLDPTKTGASNPAVFAAASAARTQGQAQGLTGEALEKKVLIATIEASKPQAQNYSSLFAPQAQIASPASQQLSNRVESVGPVPEPPTNVIVAPQQTPTQQSIPSASGASNDVPAIPTGNIDNFYLLYSHVQYNIASVS